MEFGKFLRHKRKMKKQNIYQFSQAIGISGSYLSSLENGLRNPPSFELLTRIADYLELDQTDRATLFDLAAKNKKPPEIAGDLTAYIYSVPKLHETLRLSLSLALTDENWEQISQYIKDNF